MHVCARKSDGREREMMMMMMMMMVMRKFRVCERKRHTKVFGVLSEVFDSYQEFIARDAGEASSAHTSCTVDTLITAVQ